ncbi:MAG: T9SS type A sorting domain-containing protein [Polaribacter sp.]
MINGEGSGTYQEGEVVHIWSNTPANNSVFTKWISNEVAYLKRKNEWHTTLIIPQNTNIGNISLTANFVTLSTAILRSSKTFMLEGQNGANLTSIAKESFYSIPPSPKGIVFLFHGTGGKGSNFFERFESLNIIKDLVKNNYAVFTLDSNETTIGDQNGDEKLRWNSANTSLNNNVDLRNVSALKTAILNEFSLPEKLPVFSLGMSAGAVFSDICASVLNFNASIHITAKGRESTYESTDVSPIIWIMSENDNNSSADNAVALNHYNLMKQIQTTEWLLLPKTPLHEKRFLRSLQGVSEQQSIAIFNKLKANNYLDSNNLINIKDVKQIPNNFYNNLGLTIKQKVEVLEQLLYANADHILHSEYNKAIISFLDNNINILGVDNYINFKENFVSPNPASDKITLNSLKHYNSLETFVFSMTGKLLIKSKNSNQINISSLANGLYLVKVILDGKIHQQKFIKNK